MAQPLGPARETDVRTADSSWDTWLGSSLVNRLKASAVGPLTCVPARICMPVASGRPVWALVVTLKPGSSPGRYGCVPTASESRIIVNVLGGEPLGAGVEGAGVAGALGGAVG